MDISLFGFLLRGKTFTIVGLLYDVIGVGLVSREFFKSEDDIIKERKTYVGANPHKIKSARKQYRYGKLGLRYIILGFIFQIIGQL